jgi:FdhE protein
LKTRRSGPADWAGRLDRIDQIGVDGAAAEPLRLLAEVLRYQRASVKDPQVVAGVAAVSRAVLPRRLTGSFPLLDVGRCADELCRAVLDAVPELSRVSAVPAPLRDAGRELSERSWDDRSEIVEAWIENPHFVDPRDAFWLHTVAAPILEEAAAPVEVPSRSRWSDAVCPVCGGAPDVSVIGEESGEFMAGSPRYLVCSRCASWWGFARAKCFSCREEDSRRLASYTAEDSEPARIDVCESCGSYIKTFDLRRPGGRDIVPLVDDVATMALDLWAHDQGWHRPSLSLAGV